MTEHVIPKLRMQGVYAFAVCLSVAPLQASDIVYSNLVTAPVSGYAHGSTWIYDDIVTDLTDVTDTFIESLEITCVNFDYLDLGGFVYPGGDLQRVDVWIEFRSADMYTGLPDVLLGSFAYHLEFSPNPIPADGYDTVVIDLSDKRIDTTSWDGLLGFFWIGISWHNSVGLFEGDDVVGQLLYDMTWIGLSQDLLSDGSGGFNFGGSVPANFGYELILGPVKPGSDCDDQNWDLDQDNDVDRDDLDGFSLCCNGPERPRDTQCLLSFIDADCDNDGDVDMVDFQSLMLAVGTSG